MCSDRLDTDFSDIDLSQLDTSDFDSVNCLSELQWCNDQSADASPASIHYSTADELFEVRFLSSSRRLFSKIRLLFRPLSFSYLCSLEYLSILGRAGGQREMILRPLFSVETKLLLCEGLPKYSLLTPLAAQCTKYVL